MLYSNMIVIEGAPIIEAIEQTIIEQNSIMI